MTLEEYFRTLDLGDIDDFVSEGRQEDLHLDFKLVKDPGLDKDDRRTFAKAVSGFANSDGGLIVWGIDARKNAEGVDCAQGKPGVSCLKRRLTKLNEFTGSVVNPTVIGVAHRTIESGADHADEPTLSQRIVIPGAELLTRDV
jgi:Putative DNA-binding domain